MYVHVRVLHDVGTIVVGTGGAYDTEICEATWGHGEYIQEQCRGGIYMASNIRDTCAIWPCKLSEEALVGAHGSLEHVRAYIPVKPIKCEANQLYWITDKTPHESSPMQRTVYLQFFRLVTSQVTAWYADHSTANPLVASDALIVSGNKFGAASDTC